MYMHTEGLPHCNLLNYMYTDTYVYSYILFLYIYSQIDHSYICTYTLLVISIVIMCSILLEYIIFLISVADFWVGLLACHLDHDIMITICYFNPSQLLQLTIQPQLQACGNYTAIILRILIEFKSGVLEQFAFGNNQE